MSDENLLTSIDPHTIGIIWVTKEKLSLKSTFFSEFDYLMDGMISKAIKRENDKSPLDNKNLFISKSFGHPFFIGHVEAKDNHTISKVEEILNIMSTIKTERKIVKIYQTNTNDILPELSKKTNINKQFEFEKIN